LIAKSGSGGSSSPSERFLKHQRTYIYRQLLLRGPLCLSRSTLHSSLTALPGKHTKEQDASSKHTYDRGRVQDPLPLEGNAKAVTLDDVIPRLWHVAPAPMATGKPGMSLAFQNIKRNSMYRADKKNCLDYTLLNLSQCTSLATCPKSGTPKDSGKERASRAFVSTASPIPSSLSISSARCSFIRASLPLGGRLHLGEVAIFGLPHLQLHIAYRMLSPLNQQLLRHDCRRLKSALDAAAVHYKNYVAECRRRLGEYSKGSHRLFGRQLITLVARCSDLFTCGSRLFLYRRQLLAATSRRLLALGCRHAPQGLHYNCYCTGIALQLNGICITTVTETYFGPVERPCTGETEFASHQIVTSRDNRIPWLGKGSKKQGT
jgi:hypothetical protein